MGRPLREATIVAGTGLVSAYIEYIGVREPENSAAIRNCGPDSPYRASLMIGASCLRLVHGQDRAADALLGSAHEILERYRKGQGRHAPLGSVAAQMELIAVMLLDRDNPGAAHQFQLASHTESIADLKLLRPIWRRTGSTWAEGALGEQALFSLTTRDAGPGTLAVRSLWHHDNGRRRLDNTDLVVVNLGTDTNPPTVSRGQLKQYCLGFDGETEGKVAGEETRADYMLDIVLISGHCDVLDPTTGHTLNGLGRRLQAEARGEASPAQIAILDEATLHVLQTITDPEAWRMGTKHMVASLEASYAG